MDLVGLFQIPSSSSSASSFYMMYIVNLKGKQKRPSECINIYVYVEYTYYF